MAREDARDRNAFMEHCRQVIVERGDSHPLRHVLLDENGDWKGPRTAENQDVPTVQAGHVTTRGFAREFDPRADREGDGFTTPIHDRFALEDPVFNVEFGGRMGEGNTRRGDFNIISREAVDIDGVPVDRRTAEMLERTGELHVPGGVDSLPRSAGWQPPWATDPVDGPPGVEAVVGLGLTAAFGLAEAVAAGAAWLGLTDGVVAAGAVETATVAEGTEVTTGPRIAEEIMEWSRARDALENAVVQDSVRYRVAGATTEAALVEAAEAEAAVAQTQSGQSVMRAGALIAGSAGDIPTPTGDPGKAADPGPSPSSSTDSAGGLPVVPAPAPAVPSDIPPPVAGNAHPDPSVPPHTEGVPHDVPAPVPQIGDFPTPEPPHSPDLPPGRDVPGGQVPPDEVPPNMQA